MEKTNNSQKSQGESMTRRNFIGSAATTAAAFMIVPRHALGGPGYIAPSDKLNIACVGIGGKGSSDFTSVAKENIIAICDVDATQFEKCKEHIEKEASDQTEIMKKFEKAPRYKDFRKMLDKEKSIDAITISTPDHTHAVVAMMAIKLGKHVFCQKPLTHTVYEARMLAKTAKEMNVVTQMGNQGHASEVGRLINEWIWDGAIGDVHEVHCWTDRPIWPQGIEAPKEIPSVPPTMEWDLWLGPAPWRPYHPAYAPFAWRGWIDFGTGAVGDMGAHIIDHPYWALKLGSPTTIQASSTELVEGSYPLASIVHYTFPARGNMPPVKMTWYDCGLTPPRPATLEQDRRLGDGGGVLFYGDKGILMCSTYGRNPRLIPETAMKAYQRPEKTIPRSPGIHEEWIEACKNGTKSTTDFSYSGPLTEMMLLGNVATMMKEKNTILEWDAENMKITNLPEANDLLHTEYREGWTL